MLRQSPIHLTKVLAASLLLAAIAQPLLASPTQSSSTPSPVPAPTWDSQQLNERLKAPLQLPPPADGIMDLKFGDFFKRPVGARGLEPSTLLRDADGKRVRMIGYMVRQEKASQGYFILAPFPAATSEESDGPADDLPPQIAYVRLPQTERELVVQWAPQIYLVQGVLRVGSFEQPDGRIAMVELAAELPSAAADADAMTVDASLR